MTPVEIEKLLTRLFSERFTQLGYKKNRHFANWFVKRHSDDLTIGIHPKIKKNRGSRTLTFNFGVYFCPMEEELDLLGSRTTFDGTFDLDKTNKWTFTRENVAFPIDYFYPLTFDKTLNMVVFKFGYNYCFGSELSDQEVVAQANRNLKTVEAFSIPWLENLDRKKILMELKRSFDTTKLIGYYFENDYEQVESLTAECMAKNYLEKVNWDFYGKLLQASRAKKMLGIKDGGEARLVEEARIEKIREEIKKLIVERFIEWGYQRDDTFQRSDIFYARSVLYVKDRTEDITSGILLNLKRRPGDESWHAEIDYFNSHKPIENQIDLWNGDKLRSDPQGWERWTVKENLHHEFPLDYLYTQRHSETNGCINYVRNSVDEIPFDLSDEEKNTRVKLMLDMIEKYCIPSLEQAVDLNGIISRLHRAKDDGIRLHIAYYLANDFDRAAELAKNYVRKQFEWEDHPIWKVLLRECDEGRSKRVR